MSTSKTIGERLINGILKENPTFVLMLGMCPTLAVTTSAMNGFGMGATTLVVLALSNLIISLLRNIIPNKVRIPAFIVIIASFVTAVQLLLQAYLPSLNEALGVYIPLIVVNCIILGRAESYAYSNPPIPSLFDGIGMGLGFTIALSIIGGFREVFGTGKLFNIQVMPKAYTPVGILVLAPGAFFVLAFLCAAQNYAKKKLEAMGRDASKIGSGCSEDCMNCNVKGCARRFYDAEEEFYNEGEYVENKQDFYADESSEEEYEDEEYEDDDFGNYEDSFSDEAQPEGQTSVSADGIVTEEMVEDTSLGEAAEGEVAEEPVSDVVSAEEGLVEEAASEENASSEVVGGEAAAEIAASEVASDGEVTSDYEVGIEEPAVEETAGESPVAETTTTEEIVTAVSTVEKTDVVTDQSKVETAETKSSGSEAVENEGSESNSKVTQQKENNAMLARKVVQVNPELDDEAVTAVADKNVKVKEHVETYTPTLDVSKLVEDVDDMLIIDLNEEGE